MEKKKRSFQMPHTYIIIFGVILVAAILTLFIPLGQYDTKAITYTVNGEKKTRTVVDPDSFRYVLDENGVQPGRRLSLWLIIVTTVWKRF